MVVVQTPDLCGVFQALKAASEHYSYLYLGDYFASRSSPWSVVSRRNKTLVDYAASMLSPGWVVARKIETLVGYVASTSNP